MGGPRPPAGREDAEGAALMPYRYENSRGQTYYLHGKEVTLQNGRKQRIFYFAREPKAGEALDALPPDREVVENPRTGLPFLKGTGAAPGAATPAKRPARKGASSAADAQRTSTSR
jgi:hypothetical protein